MLKIIVNFEKIKTDPKFSVLMRQSYLYRAYKIKLKDTLYSISKKFKVSIEQILELNKDITDRSLIYKSDIIAIPLSE